MYPAEGARCCLSLCICIFLRSSNSSPSSTGDGPWLCGRRAGRQRSQWVCRSVGRLARRVDLNPTLRQGNTVRKSELRIDHSLAVHNFAHIYDNDCKLLSYRGIGWCAIPSTILAKHYKRSYLQTDVVLVGGSKRLMHNRECLMQLWY